MTLLLLLIAVVSVSVDSVASGGRPLSIPLVPHHVQRRRLQLLGVGDIGGGNRGRRRRRDARSLHESDDESDDESDPDLNFHEGEQPEKVLNISDANHMQIASLYQGYGTHYADLWCGKPTAQRQTVIVDTGSGVTAFPCVGCDPDACGVPKYHLDPLFDPDLSSSYHKLECSECQRGTCDSNAECHIGMSYQEGSSWYAFEVTDSCYVGGIHDFALPSDNAGKDDLDPFHAPAFRFPLTFGCQTKLTGLFKTQLADGIMGMDHAEAAFWYQASNKLGLPRKFSLCFSRSPTASRQGTNAGAMTIGGTDSRLHGSEMVYSSVSAGGGFYDVTIRQVYLRQGGGESAAYDAGAKVVPLLLAPTSGIVDSGTTDTYFSRNMKGAFDKAFQSMVGEAYTHDDVKLTEAELLARPTILIQLAGDVSMNEKLGAQTLGLAGSLDPDHPFDVILAVPASHYYEYDLATDTYTARFYPDEGGGNVIGANSMMGHDVFFEVDSDRIGWSESSCDYPALVQPFLDSSDLVPADTSREQGPGSGEPGTSQVPDSSEPGTSQEPDGNEAPGTSQEPDNSEPGTSQEPDSKEAPGTSPEPDSNETPEKINEPKDQGTTDEGSGANGGTEEASSSAHDQDKPSGDVKQSPTETCSATCKFGVVASVLMAGVIVVLILIRRGGSGRRKRYMMAHHAELELSDVGCADSDEFQVQYRDRPSNARSQYDAEEQETGILS